MSEPIELKEALEKIKKLEAQLMESKKRHEMLCQSINNCLNNSDNMASSAISISKNYAVEIAEILHHKSDEKKAERWEAHLSFINWKSRAGAFNEALQEIRKQTR